MTKLPPPPEKISDPKISIVIPLFNAEKFIKTCIDSILDQSFKDFEVIVIDDCSTDRSAEIVESYQDPRIKIFKQIKNSGESSSRNLGLTLARGEYVYFMDDDDALMPNTLEIFFKSAEHSQSDVVIMNSYYQPADPNFSFPAKIKIERKSIYNPNPRTLSDNLEERLRNEYINSGIFVMPWLRIQRREFLLKNQIYFPIVEMGGDILLHFAELCLGKKMQVIDSCCYIYRQHSGQTMKLSTEKHLRKAFTSIPIALKFMRDISEKIQLPRQFQILLENHIIAVNYFIPLVLPAYRGDLPREKIDEFLTELVKIHEINDPDLLRVLINLSADKLIENSAMRMMIMSQRK